MKKLLIREWLKREWELLIRELLIRKWELKNPREKSSRRANCEGIVLSQRQVVGSLAAARPELQETSSSVWDRITRVCLLKDCFFWCGLAEELLSQQNPPGKAHRQSDMLVGMYSDLRKCVKSSGMQIYYFVQGEKAEACVLKTKQTP